MAREPVNSKVASDRPVCAVCGTDTEAGGSFMRLHLETGRLEFCTPQCVRVYHADPGRFDHPKPPPKDGMKTWAVRWGP